MPETKLVMRGSARGAREARSGDHESRMNMESIEEQIALLTLAEKAQLLLSMAKGIGDASPGIENTPGVCGGDACIARTRIPVWLLEELRRQGASEAEILHSYPTLRAQDLVNAWAYVRNHQDEIERSIRENEEA